MTPPVRVCHVITGLELGGAETMLAKLCEHVPATRLQQSVVSLRGGGPLAARIRSYGVPVHEGTMRPGRVPSIADLRWVTGTLRSVGPDVVHGWMYHGNIAATLARRGDAPVAWNVRQTLYDMRNEKRLTRLIIRAGALLSRRAAAIVYNSTVSARQHAAIGFAERHAIVIPNGFDVERFAPAAAARVEVRRELGIADDALLVGLFARFHPMKDHATFLAAARNAFAAIPDAHFLLAGEGINLDGSMASLLPPGPLRDRVHLLGARRDVSRLTASLDIACSASAWGEGFPNVLGEALACAVPCVATDVGDSAYVIGDAGRVVPPRDVDAFGKALTELLRDAELRRALGEIGRRRVLDRFAIGRVSESYVSLYHQLTGRETAPATH